MLAVSDQPEDAMTTDTAVHSRLKKSRANMRVEKFCAWCIAMAIALALAKCLPALAQSVPDKIPDNIEQRTMACIACHGKQGQGSSGSIGSYVPRIAGKPAGYLYNQLVNFRDGRRQSQAMTYMVDHLSDAYLMEIAQYFADLHVPYPDPHRTSSHDAQPARGQTLVMLGDPSRNVPACIACHGERLTGYAPAVPALIGLPQDYLNAQFGNWLNKTRRTAQPDCMAQVVARLSPADINAVSAWLAAQNVPADSAPAMTLPNKMPLACGSVK